MGDRLKIGDKVRVVGIPPILPEDDLKTRSIFTSCLGRAFPIVSFNGHLLELEVGEAVGELPYIHTIWIEPQFVEILESTA